MNEADRNYCYLDCVAALAVYRELKRLELIFDAPVTAGTAVTVFSNDLRTIVAVGVTVASPDPPTAASSRRTYLRVTNKVVLGFVLYSEFIRATAAPVQTLQNTADGDTIDVPRGCVRVHHGSDPPLTAPTAADEAEAFRLMIFSKLDAFHGATRVTRLCKKTHHAFKDLCRSLGHALFMLPQDKLDEFKAEVRDIVMLSLLAGTMFLWCSGSSTYVSLE